jgi:peroxiredoxin
MSSPEEAQTQRYTPNKKPAMFAAPVILTPYYSSVRIPTASHVAES